MIYQINSSIKHQINNSQDQHNRCIHQALKVNVWSLKMSDDNSMPPTVTRCIKRRLITSGQSSNSELLSNFDKLYSTIRQGEKLDDNSMSDITETISKHPRLMLAKT